jgi:hypothetical protein
MLSSASAQYKYLLSGATPFAYEEATPAAVLVGTAIVATPAAGNTRGASAVDLQLLRAAATQVASGTSSAIGGGKSNTASAYYGFVGGGQSNTASADYAAIGGGKSNAASVIYATIGGGKSNTASASYATIGGGQSNAASASYATIGGGGGNKASAYYATVGGGKGNTASASYATVGGGKGNTASASYATVGGGYGNMASGAYSWAGGRQAQTGGTYAGVFVWADSTAYADFNGIIADEFALRARGGFRHAYDGSNYWTAKVASNGVTTFETLPAGAGFIIKPTITLVEVTAPTAPAADRVIIYAEDNGAGKTRLMALFSSGAAQQIAIQP